MMAQSVLDIPLLPFNDFRQQPFSIRARLREPLDSNAAAQGVAVASQAVCELGLGKSGSIDLRQVLHGLGEGVDALQEDDLGLSVHDFIALDLKLQSMP